MSGSSISGNIFLDKDGDGSIGANDSFLSGVPVTLYVEVGTTGIYLPTLYTATTGANGSYSFSNLPAGIYSVHVTAPSGMSFSSTGTSSTQTNATIGTLGTSAAPITIGTNTVVTNQDAGLYKPASFSGTVFQDSNNDGFENHADAGISGVTVQLLNGSGNVISTTTTGSDGSYTFANLAPGTYSAHIVAPSGSTYSVMGNNTTPQPTGGTTTLGANLLMNGQFASGSSSYLAGWSETANTAATPWGYGPGGGVEEYSYATKLSYYGTPASYSTTTSAGSPPADTVSPYYTTAPTTAAFFVDDGAIETLYQTVNVVAGTTYEIGFDLAQTSPGYGNPGYFSVTASVNGTPVVIASSTAGTLASSNVWTHYAGLYTAMTTGSVTLGFTYESGVPGSTLYGKDVLMDDVYMAGGQYTTNLTTTSEVNPATGTTTPVTLSSGQSVGNESAGIVYQPATITGTIFSDSNKDGLEESTESGAAGVTVNLKNASGTVVATTTTGTNGTYTFANQAAGTYTVQVSTPTGDTFSPAPSASTSPTLTHSMISSSGTGSVTVVAGGTGVVNAGFYGGGTVSGTVFNDLNGDGADSGADTGIAGQTVTLYAANGTTVVSTTTTNSYGGYSFTNVTAGSYVLSFGRAGGLSFSAAGTSTTAPNSNVTSSGSAAITVVSGGTVMVNAGEFAPTAVNGTVFNDLNADGTMGTGDTGLAGQTVNLLKGTSVVATATTSASGSYSFSNVAPGSYMVSVAAAAAEGRRYLRVTCTHRRPQPQAWMSIG